MKIVLLPVLADMGIPGKNFGIRSEATGAGDAFVLMTLGFLFFLFAAFAYAAWYFWKRETCPEPHVLLLMELEGDEPSDAPTSESPVEGIKEWEQSPDWWKN